MNAFRFAACVARWLCRVHGAHADRVRTGASDERGHCRPRPRPERMAGPVKRPRTLKSPPPPCFAVSTCSGGRAVCPMGVDSRGKPRRDSVAFLQRVKISPVVLQVVIKALTCRHDPDLILGLWEVLVLKFKACETRVAPGSECEDFTTFLAMGRGK